MNKTEKIINELYEIETNGGCHEDYVEDYKTKKDFYLSNVICDDWIGYVTGNFGVTKEEAENIRVEVIQKIESNY